MSQPATKSQGLASRKLFWLSKVDAWADVASDWVNPILVKETRQALKSQQFVLWFLLLLGGCWVVTIGGLAALGPKAYYGSFGNQMYQWYAWMLAFPLLVVTPFSAFRSLASEQEDNTRDVLTVSSLSPRQVVNGKLGSAVVQMLIYLSALAPCLGFTYLLRGVDALTLVLLPAMGLLVSLGLSLIGLLLASVATQRYQQVLASVALVGGLLMVFWGSLFVIEEFISNGYRMYQSRDFWIAMASLVSLYVTTFVLAYCATVACNTFTSANRSTALRVAMLLQQAAYVGWCGFIVQEEGSFPGIMLFAVAAFYWAIAGMAITSEQPIQSERIRRSLPDSFLGRTLFTWLMPGPGLGYFFVVANLSFWLALLYFWSLQTMPRQAIGPFMQWLLAVVASGYLLAYLGVGRLVITAIRRVTPLSLLGGVLIQFLLMLGGWSFPFIMRASFLMFRRLEFSYIDLPSLPAMLTAVERTNMKPAEEITSAILLAGAFLSVLLANIALTVREVRQTRSPIPQRVVEDQQLLTPKREMESNPWGDRVELS